MILKHADDKVPALAKLEALLKTERVPAEKVAAVKEELRVAKAGLKGEEQSSYLIDFYFQDADATMVIHDLRLELPDGRVAQIDHLLIQRAYRFYVLETKHFAHGVKITEEGEFLRWDDWKRNYVGMASPIEQNHRHVHILKRVIEGLGLPEATIKPFILVSPDARIDRPKNFDTSMVVKADQFLQAMLADLNSANPLRVIGGAAKALWHGSVEEVAKRLVACHQPAPVNYFKKLGFLPLPERPRAIPMPAPAAALADEKMIPATAQEPLETANHRCRFCGGSALSARPGKYGPYFKCTQCDGNTPIKVTCGKPGHKERLRQDGPRFFRECPDCKSSQLYFENSAS